MIYATPLARAHVRYALCVTVLNRTSVPPYHQPQAGCKLVLVARREQKLKELREEILSVYPLAKVHLLVLDVSDLAAIAELPKTLPEEFAEVDILVNNAGLALGKWHPSIPQPGSG